MTAVNAQPTAEARVGDSAITRLAVLLPATGWWS